MNEEPQKSKCECHLKIGADIEPRYHCTKCQNICTPPQPQKSKCENIDFDSYDFIPNNVGDDVAIGRWFKGTNLVKEIRVARERIIFKKFPICMACWKWRGDFIEMSLLRKNREDEQVNQCPRCRGLFSENPDCICGEIPHRVACAFGFEIYMNILKKVIQ